MEKKTFRYRLVMLFIVSIMVPLVVLGSTISLYYNDRSRRVNELNISNTLYMVSENIRIYLDDLKRLSISPNVYPDVMNYYLMLNQGSSDVSYSNYQLARNYRTLMQRLLTLSRQDIRGVAFIPANNPEDAVYTIDAQLGLLSEKTDYDYRSKEWYDEILGSGGTPVFSATDTLEYYNRINPNTGLELKGDDYEEGLFSVGRMVYDENDRSVIGIIRVDASSLVIRDIFQRISTSANSGLLLLDRHGRVIHTSRPGLAELAGRVEDGALMKAENDSYRCSVRTIDGSGWRLVYLDSTKDATSQTRSIVTIAMLMSFCCLLVGFAIFNVSSCKITRPVHSIIEAMREVEKGNLKVRCRLSPSVNQEFTLISEEMNHMIDKLETLINREYKAVISQRNAELLALQTQINPHFLYNTLNGFITLNRLEEKKKLEASILRLTSMFRYTCGGSGSTTIGEEMRFIEMYLALQQLRFEDRLQYRITVGEDAGRVVVPRLLVQPLVENAVIHGMEPSDKEFLLEVDAMSVEHPLFGALTVITVADNGVGFDANRLPGSKRVGLKNVAERLELFHGQSFLKVKSTPGTGTWCQIVLPQKPPGRPHQSSGGAEP